MSDTFHFTTSTPVNVTGPINPESRGSHFDASNMPFVLFSSLRAGMLAL